MKFDLDSLIKKKSQLEEEKILFGGEIYQHRHILPKIKIDMSNHEEYSILISKVKQVGQTIGSHIAHLFAELVILYQVTENNLKNPVSLSIQQISTHMLGKIAFAMLQVDKLENILEENDDYDMVGDDYCFISIMLQDLFNSYSFMLSFVQRKRYFSPEDINSIRNILNFFISSQYEELREMFYVAQGYTMIEKQLEDNNINTVH